MIPFIYDTETIVQKSNLGVSESYMRLTFRFINNTENLNNHTNDIFPRRLKTFEIASSKPSSNEVQVPEFTTKNVIIFFYNKTFINRVILIWFIMAITRQLRPLWDMVAILYF